MYSENMITSSRSYYESIQSELEGLKKKEEEKREKAKERQEDRKRKLFGRNGESPKMKESKRKISELRDISDSLSDAEHNSKPNTNYTPSVELTELLDRFSRIADQSEVFDLFREINKDIGEINSVDKKKFEKKIEEIQDAIKESSYLSNRYIGITENGIPRGIRKLKEAVQEFERLRKKEFDAFSDKNKLKVPNLEKIVLNDYHELRELANSDYLENNKKNNKFKNNINEIIEALKNRDKATDTILLCEGLKKALQAETEKGVVNYDDALQAVEKIISSNKHLLEEAKESLAKFNLAEHDIDNYMEQAKDSRQQRVKNDKKESVEATYARIAKEIYRTQNTEPVDYQRLEELRNELNKLRINNADVDINYDQYQQIQENAVYDEIKQDALDQMMETERTKEQKLIAEVNKYYAEDLRRRAEEELKRSGAFDPIYQEAGLDVRDANSNNNRNKAILEKMRELAIKDRASEMQATVQNLKEEVSKLRALASDDLIGERTPEAIEARMHDLIIMAKMPNAIERGLYDWKKQGRLPDSATVNDLNPTERNDINIGYSDGAFSEIKEVVGHISQLSQGLDQKQIEEAYRRGGGLQY